MKKILKAIIEYEIIGWMVLTIEAYVIGCVLFSLS